LSQNATGQYANSAFIHANSAYESQNATGQYANSAFIQANAGILHAQSAFNQANAGFIQANAGITHAQSAFDIANAGFIQANAGILHAQSAFIQANAGIAHAQTAYNHANAGFTQANVGILHAQSAFTQANSNYISAVTRLSVTNSGASAYLLDQYSGNNPTIYVRAGETIAFNLNVVGHPFMIRLSSGGANYDTGLIHVATDGTVSTTSSAQGKISGTLYWKVPFDIVGSTYVYQCSIHGGMVGNIVIEQPTIVALNMANSAFIHANAAYISQNATGQYANSAFIHANSSYNSQNATGQYANAAFNHANAAFISANNVAPQVQPAFNTANSAFIRANNSLNANVGGTITGNVVVIGNVVADAFQTSGPAGDITGANAIFANYIFGANGSIDLTIYANNAYANANAGFVKANGAYDHANAAFDAANNATDTYVRNHANSAFIHANSAYQSQNATGQYANSAFIHANSAYIHVNAAFAFANTISGGSAIDNVARDSANSAGIYANGAFVRANNSLNANVGGQITGDVSITGNLIVTGNTVYANTQTLLIADNIITLNAALGQASAPTMDAGVEVDRGNQPNVAIIWNETTDKWTFTNDGTTYSDLGSGSDSAGSYANSAFIQANAAFAVANAANAAAANGGSVVVTFATEPPVTGNANGHIWIDSNDGTEYTYFKDSDGFQWVEFGPTSSNVTTNTFITANIISSYSQANAAFTKANAASQHANAGFEIANGAASLANSAYAAANNVTSDRLSSNLKLNIIQVLESANIYTTAIGGNVNIDIGNNTSYFFSANTTANVTFNLRGNATTTFDTTVAIGQTASVAIALKQGDTKYKANVYIDGVLQTPYWLGNSSPGYATTQQQSIDVYTYTVFKTAASTYSILAANSNFGLAQGQPGQG
jgi:hypothetical protein